MNMYYAVLAIFLIGVFCVWRIVNSPFGAILKSIRENETRAISLGLSVSYYKLAAFVMSAAIAGLAGATKALVFQFATLTECLGREVLDPAVTANQSSRARWADAIEAGIAVCTIADQGEVVGN